MPKSRQIFADTCLQNGVNLSPETVIFDITDIAAMEVENAAKGVPMTELHESITAQAARCNPMFSHSFFQWSLETDASDMTPADYQILRQNNPHYKPFDLFGLYLEDVDRANNPKLAQDCRERVNLPIDSPCKLYLCAMYCQFWETLFHPNRTGALLVFNPDGSWNQAQSAAMNLAYPNAVDMPLFIAYGLVLYSLSLMHKKTPIEFVDYPRNYRRRIERETGKQPSPYFWVNIDLDKPRKKYKASASPASKKDSTRPVHIVRGYWLHQPENHPLPQFRGKTFWVEDQIKGGDKAEKGQGKQLSKGYKLRLKGHIDE